MYLLTYLTLNGTKIQSIWMLQDWKLLIKCYAFFVTLNMYILPSMQTYVVILLYYISSANYQDINFYLLFIVLHLIKYEISGCPIQKFLQGERQQLVENNSHSSQIFSFSYLNSKDIDNTVSFEHSFAPNLKLTKLIIRYFLEMTQSMLEVFKHKQWVWKQRWQY